jgi:hypothetical protein
LSFITLVEKRGAGPSWKYQGIPNDGSWYESQL